MKRFMQKAGISLALVTLFAATLFGQKMTAEQIIAKHLDSIGTAEARGAIKDMVARGNVVYGPAFGRCRRRRCICDRF